MHSCGHGNSPRHLGSSVDVENGIVRREIFTDRRIYDEEQEKIFSRSWLFVGHENQIASPGDYILGRMGEESVIVTRDEKGKIHVLLNNCRHRGMRVCRYDRGNTSFFSCPYHGWTFSNEGKLVKVPKLDSAYHKKLDPSKWGLVEARAHVHRGTIWATWNQDGPSFEEYMGSSLFFFDAFIGMYDGGEGEWEAFGGIIKWKIPCNWKFGAENFSGDYYHNFSHSSADRVSFSPSGQKGRHTYDPVTRAEAPYRLNIAVDKTGHTALGQLFKGDHDYVPIYQEMPIVEEYFRQAFYKRREKLKEKARWFPHHGTIFPNLSYSRVTMSIASWHPSGPNETEVWRIFLVPKDAPTEVKDVMRHYAIRYQAPCRSDRAGRYGKLALRPRRITGVNCKPLSIQLRNGDWIRKKKLARPLVRTQRSSHGRHYRTKSEIIFRTLGESYGRRAGTRSRREMNAPTSKIDEDKIRLLLLRSEVEQFFLLGGGTSGRTQVYRMA